MSRRLAELLVKERIISPTQFQEAEAAARGGQDYIRFLIERRYVAETKLPYFLSQKFGLPSINLAKYEIPVEVLRLVPPELAKRASVIPIQANKGTLVVAVCDPSNLHLLEDVKFAVKMNVEAVL